MAGLYIHIPFCKKKCIYCDFFSIANRSDEAEYVLALLSEFDMRISELKGADIETIYIGGGTPSVLSEANLSCLIEGLKQRLDFNKVQEFTIEVNPDDVTQEFANRIVELGINRVSMGVQSFVDSELKLINRRHDAKGAVQAVETLKAAGISNISIDLIYGLPTQTLDSWQYSVAEAIKLNVKHISAYSLSYEEGTALYVLRERGKITECDEDDCVKMYDLLVAMLREAGFLHYEISNFAQSQFYSRHNSNYWNKTPYLGLGCSAHSYDGKERSYNIADVKKYVMEISSGATVKEVDETQPWEQYNEDIMIGLRTMWGVDLSEIDKRYGKNVADKFKNTAEKYLLAKDMKRSENNYSLTEQGVMIADLIIRDLMQLE